MKTDRRGFIGMGGALMASSAVPGFASVFQAQRSDADSAAEHLMAEIAEEILVDYPENAGALGLDKDRRASLKSRLTDRSPAGMRRNAAAATDRLARLKTIDTSGLSPAVATDVRVATIAHEIAVQGFAFQFGDVVTLSQQWSYRNSPYATAQNFGSFVEIPDFLDTSHTIADAADAQSYLTRIEAYADALDGETARLRHDASIGVVAPDFLLDKIVRQLTAARAQPVEQWLIVESLARRAAQLGGDFGRQGARIAAEKVAPALDRQIAELKRQQTFATSDAGVWKLPDGEAYYDWALYAGTTTKLTPDDVHRLGNEQLRAISAQMDPLLRAQGLTQGSVGERMIALGKDRRHYFAEGDAGRAEVIKYLEGRVADIRQRLPRAFATLVPGGLVVKRVPPEIEAGVPAGYASTGSIDGSIPGSFYVNLQDPSLVCRYALPTLTYHEGIPGHLWQGEYSYKLPLIRSLLAFNAYSEGWALYAEQLGDELGAYDGDPLGRLGYLQSIMFRACRMVVDTGIHSKRWTRQQAAQWLAATNGSTVDRVMSEIDRYCTIPGQACGYKVGHSEINRLRDKAKAALGTRYDLRLFDDAVVKAGGVPLTLLERIIDDHIALRKA